MPRIHHAFACVALAAICPTVHADVSATGTFTTSIPIETPTFRGVTAKVALTYVASAGDGLVGVGWQLDATSVIARTTARGGIPDPTPAATDRFTLDGEELVACPTATTTTIYGVVESTSTSPSCRTAFRAFGSAASFYSTRHESNQRLRYQGGSGSWTVSSPDGRTARYETYDGAQTWLLTHSEDRHHNGVDYTYTCSAGSECELSSIRWGDNGPVRGAEVDFYYETRNDVRSRGTGTSFVSMPRRLRTIAVEVGGTLARAYALRYVPSPISRRSLLASVQKYASDVTLNKTNDPGKLTVPAYGTPPLPARTFTAASQQTQGGGWSFGTLFGGWALFRMPAAGATPAPRYSGYQLASGAGTRWDTVNEVDVPLATATFVGDFDGDGRTDVGVGAVKKECQSVGIGAALTRKGGAVAANTKLHDQFSQKGSWGCTPTYLVADIDGDHRDDVLYTFRGQLYAAQLSGTQFRDVGVPLPWSHDLDHCSVDDVDGDSRDDLVCVDMQAGTVTLFTFRAKGNNLYDQTSMTPGVGLDDPRAIGDINGDGFADVIFASPNGSTHKLIVERSLGNGSYALETQTTSWAVGSADQLRAAELDGDGLADLILTRNGSGGNGGVALALAGTGVGDRFEIKSHNVAWTGSLLADVDGDGNTDIVNPANLSVSIADGQGGFVGASGVYPTLGCGGVVMIGDTDGDTRSDALCVGMPSVLDNSIHISDHPSQRALRGWHQWLSGDFNGDGRGDYAYVAAKNPGIGVTTVVWSSHPTRYAEWLQAPTATVPGLDESSATHWLSADVGGPAGHADGKDDLVMVDNDGSTLRVYSLLSNGNGTYTTVADEPWKNSVNAPIAFPQSDLHNFAAMDVDGDGNADLVHVAPYSAGVQVSVLLGNGNGTYRRPAGNAAPTYFQAASPALLAASDFQMMEVNGDGLPDLVLVRSGGGMTGTRIYSLINRGDGTFTEVTDVQSAAYLDVARWMPVDLNGDGLTDLLHVRGTNGSSNVVWLDELVQRGDGKYGLPLQATATLTGTATTDPELRGALEATNSIYPTDFDGDGLVDLLHVSRYRDAAGYRNTAIVQLTNPGNTTNLATWGVAPIKVSRTTLSVRPPWAWRHARDEAHPYGPSFVSLAGDDAVAMTLDIPSDRLAHSENGNGGATDIGYAQLFGSRAYLPGGFAPIVTTSVTRTDNAYSPAVAETTRYMYDQAQWSDRDQRMTGFEWVISTDAQLGVISHLGVDDACPNMQLSSYKFAVASGVGLTLETDAPDAPGAGPFTCRPRQVAKYACDTGGCTLEDTVTLTYDTEYGNVSETLEAPKDAPTRTSTSSYWGNDEAYVLNLPSWRMVYENATTLLEIESYIYDGSTTYMAPTGPLGEVTQIDRWDSASGKTFSTKLLYNAHGQLKHVEDPNGTWTDYGYDATYEAFPTSTCTSVGCTTTVWDTVMGVATSTTDLNHQKISNTLDKYGRVTLTERPDTGKTVISYFDLGTVTGPQAQRQRVRTDVADGSANGAAWTIQYLDGWGRTYRVEHEGGSVQLTEYADLSSRPARVSEVFDVSLAPKYYTEYTYDPLGRPTKQVAPDGTTKEWSYGTDTIDITNEQGRTRTAAYDGIGEVIRVTETFGGLPRETQYGYDANHRLVGTTDPLGLVTSYYWDSLGHLVGERDPDRGLHEYAYRPDGKLDTMTDAKGQSMVFTYDTAARPFQRQDLDEKGNVTRTITWTYDELPGQGPQGSSIGRVVQIDDTQPNAHLVTTYAYDVMGRVKEDRNCIDGACYEMKHEYDRAGRLWRLTYPDSSGALGGADEIVEYSYDDAGHLKTAGDYVKDISYEIDGRPSVVTMGNAVTTTYVYNPARRWADSMAIELKGTPIYTASYTRDELGRILDVSEVAPTNTDTMEFTYDELGRLTRVLATDPKLERHFVIDPIGRITYSSTLGDYHYFDPDHPHAVTKTDFGAVRGYDTNGNAIVMENPNGDVLKLAWTVDDHPATIATKSSQYAFAYDVTGRRMKKDAPGDSGLYPNDYLAVENGTFIKYYYAGDRLIARNDGSRLAYYHYDHSRSIRVETDSNGAVLNSYQYDVTGKPLVEHESFDDDIGFGSTRADEALGLVYMRARYYDPLSARFISADSVVRDQYAPSSHDRYAFVEGDPVNYWDPSGHLRMLIEMMMEEKQHMRSLWVKWEGSFMCENGSRYCTGGLEDPRKGGSQELPSVREISDAMEEEDSEEQDDEMIPYDPEPPPPLKPELQASVDVVDTRVASAADVTRPDASDIGEPACRPAMPAAPDTPPMQTLTVPSDGGWSEAVLTFPSNSNLNGTSLAVDAHVQKDGGIDYSATSGGAGKLVHEELKDGELLVVSFTTDTSTSKTVDTTKNDLSNKEKSGNKFSVDVSVDAKAKANALAKILTEAGIELQAKTAYQHDGESAAEAHQNNERTRTTDTSTTYHGSFRLLLQRGP
jgi:RHS repeat-associated protein